MSGEITLPGFVHDLFSTNQNTFYGRLVYGELGKELERHGLRYATTDKPFANAFPEGKALKVYKDPDRTISIHTAPDVPLGCAGRQRRAVVSERAERKQSGPSRRHS